MLYEFTLLTAHFVGSKLDSHFYTGCVLFPDPPPFLAELTYLSTTLFLRRGGFNHLVLYAAGALIVSTRLENVVTAV